MNRRCGGGSKEGCFGCGDPDHYVANCPKKSKHDSAKHFTDKYDSSKHKDKREYSSGKRDSKHKKIDKEYIKRKYLKQKKAKKHTFLASLSDLDDSNDDSASSSDDESKKKSKEKLNVINPGQGSTPHLTAELLQLKPSTLNEMMKRLGIHTRSAAVVEDEVAVPD